MKPPPLLIGATLLFWGWQANLLWLSVLAAAALECPRIFRSRWEFTQNDLDRIWNFCVALFFGGAIYAFASSDGVGAIESLMRDNSLAERSEALNKGARSVLLFFQWLPLMFLPIALAQGFGQRERLGWSTFSWWLRRQRRSALNSLLPSSRGAHASSRVSVVVSPTVGVQTEPTVSREQKVQACGGTPQAARETRALPSHASGPSNCFTFSIHRPFESGDSGLNVLWPFFAACLLAASAANERSLRFPIGLVVLAGWALWSHRPRRVPALRWSACWLLVIALSIAGAGGLHWLRSAVQRIESALVLRYASGRNFDPKESRTMLGSVGQLKTSGRIVMRVEANNATAPDLLRETSYNYFRSPHWMATKREFGNLAPENGETTWRLMRSKAVNREAVISKLLPRGEGLLALPTGVGRLEDLPAFVIETNRMGTVRVGSGPGFVRFRAAFGAGASFDSPPDSDDLDIPASDRPVIAATADALKLNVLRPEEALPALAEFFSSRFRYSTWLDTRDRTASNHTALGAFLSETRSGHCEYFATATVLLLRQAGIPARYAVGYSVQEKKGRQWLVRERHAHAWCLAWMNGSWRDIDTTPATWSEIEAGRASPWEAIFDVWSRARFAFAEWRWGAGEWRRYLIWLTVPALLLAGWRLMTKKQWKRSRANASTPRETLSRPGLDSEFYLVERRLAELGMDRRSSETPLAWVKRIAPIAAVAAPELKLVVMLHNRLRFDPVGSTDSERLSLRRQALAVVQRRNGAQPSGRGTAHRATGAPAA